MKALIVAHPDDEILWFKPSYFDKIFIIFCERHDKNYMGQSRIKVIEQHPLRQKIVFVGLEEPGFWKDNSRINEYIKTSTKLEELLYGIRLEHQFNEVFTHNILGEYGHADHILINNLVRKTFMNNDNCKIWTPIINLHSEYLAGKNIKEMEINLPLFRKIRSIYITNNAWTWNLHYYPNSYENYCCVN